MRPMGESSTTSHDKITHVSINSEVWERNEYTKILCIHAVTLSGSGGEVFRGFLVQARTVADGSPVGVFQDVGADYKLSACSPAEVITNEY